jgi:hypothetical protein
MPASLCEGPRFRLRVNPREMICQYYMSPRGSGRGTMDDSTGGVVVELKAARRERLHHDNRARQATVAFVAAATAEISRTALAHALVLQGMRMLAEDGGLGAAEDCALLALSSLASDPTSSA